MQVLQIKKMLVHVSETTAERAKCTSCSEHSASLNCMQTAYLNNAHARQIIVLHAPATQDKDSPCDVLHEFVCLEILQSMQIQVCCCLAQDDAWVLCCLVQDNNSSLVWALSPGLHLPPCPPTMATLWKLGSPSYCCLVQDNTNWHVSS